MKNSLKFLLILIAFIVINDSYAQKRFVLQQPGRFKVYNRIDSIQVNLQAGDTVYIPGGRFNFGTWNIEEDNVTILGVGFFEDSTLATGRTYLEGSINVNAQNVSISGIYLAGDISASGTTNVSNLKIERCNVSSIYLGGTQGTPLTTNSLISQNIIRGNFLSGGYTTSALIQNNVIGSLISSFDGSIFQNNFISHILANVEDCFFENNIFRFGFQQLFSSSYRNSGRNNSFPVFNSTNILINSVNNVFYSSIGYVTFKGQTEGVFPAHIGVIESGDFDLRLESGQPEIGPFAGPNAVPAGWLPSIPHIQFKEIATGTYVDDNLPIKIKVTAQQR